MLKPIILIGFIFIIYIFTFFYLKYHFLKLIKHNYMKQKITLLLSILTVFSCFSQVDVYDYQSAATKKGANYFDIVKSTRNELIKENNFNRSKKSSKALKQFERWAFNWKNKVNADGSFPSNTTGWKNMLAKEEVYRTDQSFSRSVETNNNWSVAGNTKLPLPNGYASYPGMGRVNAIAVDPNDSNIIYAGAAAGGVWKTIDGGVNWEPKSDFLAGLGVTDIIIDPSNSDIIYYATGDVDAGDISSIGLYRSFDGGESWAVTALGDINITSVLLEDDYYIGDITITPSNGAIFVTILNLVLKSTDDAKSFTPVTTGSPWPLGGVIFDPSNENNIIVSNDRGGLFASTNNGDSFTRVVNDTNGLNKTALAISPANTNEFYYLRQDGQLGKRLFSNYNQTVSRNLSNQHESQGGYNNTLAVSPVNKDLVLIGGVDVFKYDFSNGSINAFLDAYGTYNGNDNFYVHPDHHYLSFSPDGQTVYNGHDGGVHRGSINATQSSGGWTDLSNGLVITQSYNIAITPQNDDYFMMANQDNDGFSKTMVNGSVQWTSCLAGDGAGCAIDYTNSNKRYLGGTFGTLFYTTDGYSTYQGSRSYGPDNSRAAFISPITIHPTIPSILYTGYGDVRKVTNVPSGIFTDLNSSLTGTSFIEVFQNGPGQPINIYAIGRNGARKSVNDGASWSTISSPSSNRFTSFSVKNSNLSEVYATVSGYTDGDKVYKSNDGGNNWVNISDGLPNIIINEVMVHQTDEDNTLFLATELGVFTRDDSNTSWVKLGSGLPNVIVRDLKFNYTTDTLYVGTYGRGMWSINVPTATVLSVNDFTGSLNTITVYPNPTSVGSISVNFSSENLNKMMDYEIYNYVGSLVIKGSISLKNNKINTSSLSSGGYILRIKGGDKPISHKFIVN
jgi:photosystem II stability/assembly factor-like uncharacterized protein